MPKCKVHFANSNDRKSSFLVMCKKCPFRAASYADMSQVVYEPVSLPCDPMQMRSAGVVLSDFLLMRRARVFIAVTKHGTDLAYLATCFFSSRGLQACSH